MVTKHDRILRYIQGLKIGSRLSVRHTAEKMNVSEGTAYRAIKDAENIGLVSTVKRVGTVRIEKKDRGNIEKLTFESVAKIVDGQVIGGSQGLSNMLNHFVIGAMELDAIKRYIKAGDLMIAGNREPVHRYALQAGAAVLVTGGFEISSDVEKLADQVGLPVISTSYDTFTVATKINRAVYDQMIKKEIVHVSDILIPSSQTSFISIGDSIDVWQKLNRQTKHSRFPVVNRQMKVVGIVAMNDVLNHSDAKKISEVMTPDPLVVSPSTTAAAAAHRMIWEGIECLPVVDKDRHLLGIITRSDVLRALQMVQQQPQMGQTVEDLINSGITRHPNGVEGVYQFEVTPQMTDYLGSLSQGLMISIMTHVARRELISRRKGDLVTDSLSFYFFKPVQIEQIVIIRMKILEMTRRNGKLDFELFAENQLCAKAMFIIQFITPV